MSVRMEDWGVVIPAGGLVPDPLATAIGTPRKALAPVAGQPCLHWVVQAVQKAGFQNIAVVGGEDIRETVGDDLWAPESTGQIDNAAAGVERLPHCRHFLFLPADTPFLNQEGLAYFASQAAARAAKADPEWFAAGLCPRHRFDETFPDFETPAIRLREGDYHSGAYFAASREGFLQAAHLLRSLAANRKSQFRMLWKLGPWPLLRYFLHLVTIPEAETQLGKAFGGTCIVVPDCDPYAIADIDTADDYQVIQRHARELLPPTR